MEDLDRARHAYAEKIRALGGLRSASLVRALERVPREAFLGPGPWKLLRPETFGRGYELTPDADPRHVYDNVLVALDADRHLNNGEPATLARWLDLLALAPGDAFLHVGCGVGYYTAIAAEATRPGGRVVGVEIDPGLAARARRNLGAYPEVSVVVADGSVHEDAAFDAILVNAGATHVPPSWLDALRPGGRLLLPLTVELPGIGVGGGHMLLVVRGSTGYTARFVSTVGIFPCAGARTPEGNASLERAYRRGGQEGVCSLRRDPHPASPECWLHASDFCLSRHAA